MATAPATIERVLCTLPFGEEFVGQVRAAVAPAEFIHCAPNDADAIAKALVTVDVAIISGDLDDRFITAPNLKWVHCNHSGLTKSARPEVFSKRQGVRPASSLRECAQRPLRAPRRT